MKPECVTSSRYDPIKSEDTDDEDCKDNTSSSHENINIKQVAPYVDDRHRQYRSSSIL